MNSEEKDTINPELIIKKTLEIKVQLHDDIRRIRMGNQNITYDNLVVVIRQVFSRKLSRSAELLLKYKDEDGDLVTIFDSLDLANAIQSSHHTLKFRIFLNCEAHKPVEDFIKHDQGAVAYQVSAVRKELACIRDKVIHLLDELDTPQDTLNGNLFQDSKVIPYQEQKSAVDKNADGVHLATTSATNNNTAELGDKLPQFNQLELGVHGNSSTSRSEDAISDHFEKRAVASPYPNEACQQQTLCKRAFQALLTSTSYDLPSITVHLAPAEPSTLQSANTYPQSSYSPEPIHQQPYIHPMMSNDLQMPTSPQRQHGEYNYTGYHPSDAVHPINPYRRSPQPLRYP